MVACFVGLGIGGEWNKVASRHRCVCRLESSSDGTELVKFRETFANPKRIDVDVETLERIRQRIVKVKDSVRLIVEVRDPRIPMSCSSRLFSRWRDELDAESMVVYVKADFMDEHSKERVRQFTMDQMDIPYEHVSWARSILSKIRTSSVRRTSHCIYHRSPPFVSPRR